MDLKKVALIGAGAATLRTPFPMQWSRVSS